MAVPIPRFYQRKSRRTRLCAWQNRNRSRGTGMGQIRLLGVAERFVVSLTRPRPGVTPDLA